MSERYYQATSARSHLQITTTKEGLIVSLMNRSLGSNGEWSTITLNAEQVAGLREFLKCQTL
jgi:hypothetical protein